MNWNYNFNKSTKQDWINQALKDNSKLDKDFLYHPILENIKGLSFASVEDIQNSTLEYDHIRNSDWKIGTILESDSLNSCKTNVEYALQHGAECINLYCSEVKSEECLEFVLQEVIQDAVTIVIPLDQFQDVDFEKHKNVIFYTSDYLNCIESDLIVDAQKAKIQFRTEFKSSEILDSRNKIKELLQRKDIISAFNPQAIVYFNNSFLANIAYYRALSKILYSINPDFTIEIRIDDNVVDTNIYNNLILFGSIALSASLCGADIISLAPYDVKSGSKDKIWLRNSIHLQHILKSEAKLNHVIDPLSGSYYLEDLSFKIFEMLNHEN